MKIGKIGLGLLALAPAVCTILTSAEAQPGPRWRGSGGWGQTGGYARMYDPKTVETIMGEVTKVDYVTPTKGMGHGVHLLLKTDQGMVDVHLGPAWYIENQDVKIAPKDRVEVRGSRVTIGATPVVIAAEVRKGDEVLALRDDSGVPRWAGWRRGAGGPR